MNSGTVWPKLSSPFAKTASGSQLEINKNIERCQLRLSAHGMELPIQQRLPIRLMNRIQQHWKVSKQQEIANWTQLFYQTQSFLLVPCSGRCSSGGSVLVDLHDFHRPPGEVVKLLDISVYVWRFAMLTKCWLWKNCQNEGKLVGNTTRKFKCF